jgi:hypothetical protein
VHLLEELVLGTLITHLLLQLDHSLFSE